MLSPVVWSAVHDAGLNNIFYLSRSGSGLKTKYNVQPLGATELTDAEKVMVNATLESFSFNDIFVKNDWEPLKEAEERIESRFDILDL